MTYLVAGWTGLRRSEIGSLTPESFDFKEKTIKIEATISKHRREDVIPIHPTLLAELKVFLKGVKPNEPLFTRLAKRETYMMMRTDIEASGTPQETPEGIADFHALRHTYITQLFHAGATVADVKSLARHSDIATTMKYTHVEKNRQASALEKLSYSN